jgi:D-proline reductase (dithiol) PrdB
MTADEVMRHAFSGLPVPQFDTVACTPAPPLSEATVAIVTTAALAHAGEPWVDQDSGFRVFDRDDEDLIVGHNSVNFDRAGFITDRNVVYPIDRLAELARDGVIGAVARRHVAFIGSTFDLTTMRVDTGPAAAMLLRDDGVDVVLLTPV